jgi:hypothetical protein
MKREALLAEIEHGLTPASVAFYATCCQALPRSVVAALAARMAGDLLGPFAEDEAAIRQAREALAEGLVAKLRQIWDEQNRPQWT